MKDDYVLLSRKEAILLGVVRCRDPHRGPVMVKKGSRRERELRLTRFQNIIDVRDGRCKW